MSRKHECARLLSEIGYLEENQYKTRAYNNAARILKGLSDEEFEVRDAFDDFYGIGTGINSKILEFKATGTISKLAELKAETPSGLDPRFYKVREGGLITRRISYEEASEKVKELIGLFNFEFHYDLGGSLRRKNFLIGDIDLLVEKRRYKSIIRILSKQNFDKLRQGDYECSYLIDQFNNIQLDVMTTNKIEYPFQLLYITGSKWFNIKVRKRAKELGYVLNQKGLFKDGHRKRFKGNQNFKTEEDILSFLGLEYVKPEDR
jgi:DNA polymerase/3'-5' exonuclease PolX